MGLTHHYYLSINGVNMPVLAVDGVQGITEPRRRVANVGELTATIDNPAGIYSPDNTGSASRLAIGQSVVLTATRLGEGSNYTLFTGTLATITPLSDRYGRQTLQITAVDMVAKLQQAQLTQFWLPGDLPADKIIARLSNEALRSAYAEATVVFNAIAPDRSQIVVGTRVYTFKTTLASPYDVARGSDEHTSRRNLAAAIGGDGTLYNTGYKGPISSNAMVTVTENTGYTLAVTDAMGSAVEAHFGHAGDTTRRSLGQSFIPEYNGYIWRVILWFNTPTDPPSGQLIADIVPAGDDGNPDISSVPTANAVTFTPVVGQNYITLPSLVYTQAERKYWIILKPALANAAFGNWLVQARADAGYTRGSMSNFYDNSTPSYHFTSTDLRMTILCRSRLGLRARSRGAWGNNITLDPSSALDPVLLLSAFAGGTDLPSSTIYDTGKTTFEYASDRWTDTGITALDAVEEAVNNEMGFYFVSGAGVPTFRNRDWGIKGPGGGIATAYNTQAPNGLVMSPSVDRLANQVIVTYRPRQTTTSGTIARAQSAIEVPPLSTIEVSLPFTHPDTGQAIGASSIDPLQPGTHYTVNDQAGGGYDYDYTSTGRIRILPRMVLDKVVLEISNSATGPLYILGLTVSGVGLVASEPQTVVVEDANSIATYGLRSTTIDLGLITDVETARAFAAWELRRLASPSRQFESITFDTLDHVALDAGSEWLTSGLSLAPGGALRIYEDQLLGAGRSMDIRILGRAFSFSVAPDHEEMTLYGRVITSDLYWTLGYGELGTSTVLSL